MESKDVKLQEVPLYEAPPQYNEIVPSANPVYPAPNVQYGPSPSPIVLIQQEPTYQARIVLQPNVQRYQRSANSHLLWSVLNTLSCFCVGQWILLCSIPALIYSCKVNQGLQNGHYSEAAQNSRGARMFNIIASWFLLIFVVLTMIYFVSLYQYNYLHLDYTNVSYSDLESD